jgi:predicted ATPase/DNA-binding SARP family transcriptional activator/class 3 adenylate cyclase
VGPPGEPLTFLLTDIERSTFLWEQNPEAMRLVLARHDAILRDVIGRAGGTVFKPTGDGMWAVFPSRRQAVAAALEIQQAVRLTSWKEVGDFRVRIALHAGDAELREGDYFGQTVNRVARLVTVAEGDRILASDAVVSGEGEDLPAGAVALSLGDVRLRDVREPMRVYEIVPAGRASEPRLETTRTPSALRPAVNESGQVAARGSGTTSTHLTAATDGPAIRVHTLGRFEIVSDRGVIGPDQWPRRKARQLFKCLLTRPTRRLTKDEAIDLFWPDSGPEAAKTTIRSTVFVLRRMLEATGVADAADLVVVDPDGLALRRDADIWVDADAFETLLDRARRTDAPEALLDEASRLYLGSYLPDDLYEDWTRARRESLHRLWRDLQSRIAQACERRGDVGGAITALNRLLESDPCDEPVAVDLMGLLARHGRRLDALRVYEALVQKLRDELDVEPSPATRALRRELELGSAAAPAPAPARPEVVRAAPVRADGPRRGWLPAPTTSLIGREADVASACDLLRRADVRLVTLTGTGGAGKTRLALQVAAGLAESFVGGVRFVDLTTIGDPAMVLPAIAAALEVHQTVGQSLFESLVAHLRQRSMLLVLDNFEHLLSPDPDPGPDAGPDAAQEVSALLAACGALKLLVTSRTALELYGEYRYDVPLLALPERRRVVSYAAVAQSPAVRLFEERARACRADFTLTRENARAVLAICRRLDGLPLAIELAAARVDLYTPEAIVAQLKSRLDFLNRGPRDRPERHRALRRTTDWSYALLNDDERLIFARLGVFVGGCSADAAAAVLSGSGPAHVAPLRVLDRLEGLVAKSLVRLVNDAREIRFSMLPTIREYALERLAAIGEVDAISRAHADWCRTFVDAGRLPEKLVFPTKHAAAEQRDALEREHQNVRRGLRWLVSEGQRDKALELAVSMFDFWYERGLCTEGYHELAGALAEPPMGSPRLRALGLRFAGVLARHAGFVDEARTLHQRALDTFRELDDVAGQVLSSSALAQIARETHELAAESALHESSQLLAQSLDHLDQGAVGWVLHERAQRAELEGDLDGARALYQQSLQVRRGLADEYGAAWSIIDLAAIDVRRGDVDGARALLAGCPALVADEWPLPAVAAALECAGALATLEGRYEDALRLLGAAGALRETLGASPSGRLHDRLVAWSRVARDRLSGASADAAIAAGRALDLADAVSLACGQLPRPRAGGLVHA